LACPHRVGTSGVRVFRAAPAVSCRLMDALICGQVVVRSTQEAPLPRHAVGRKPMNSAQPWTGWRESPSRRATWPLMRPRTSPLFGMTGPAWRRGPR